MKPQASSSAAATPSGLNTPFVSGMKREYLKRKGAKIGLLSGMGPLAGSDVLRKAIEYAAAKYGAREDCDYPDMVLLSHGLVGFDAQGTLSDTLSRELVAAFLDLEASRPTIIGVACNTAHLLLGELKRHTKAQIVNLPQEVAKQAAKHSGKLLLLSSYTARHAALYRTALLAEGVSYLQVSEDSQAVVDAAIGLVMECKLTQAGQVLSGLVKAYKQDVACVVLGCTELPLAFDADSFLQTISRIDSNQVLAERLVDHCYAVAS